MSEPAPPPPPPPPQGVSPVNDVDSLLNDTDPTSNGSDGSSTEKPHFDMTHVDQAAADAAADATPEAAADAAPEDAAPAPIEEEIGPEFKQRKDRSCTDILCCLLMVVFFLVWIAVAYVAFFFGKPYSVIYGTDYEGNYCGYQCSEERPAASNCSATSIVNKKYAHFPRITSDLMAQADTIAAGKVPSFYTVCVEECPKQWDIKCSYDFDTTNPDWEEKIAERNAVKSCLGATGFLTKYIVSLAPELLTVTLQSSELAGDIESADFCTTVFTECDVTGVGTEMILNRCIPTETASPSNTTERCVSPLSFVLCNTTTEGFDTDCVPDQDNPNTFYETLYKPTYTYGNGYFTAKLMGDAKTSCVTKQTYTENLTEELASSDQLSYIIDAIKSVAALFADIVTAWQPIVLVGCVACMILSWLYVGLLRFCAPLLVWGTCILLEIIFLCLTPWLLIRGKFWNP